jgi:hypothetical protein
MRPDHSARQHTHPSRKSTDKSVSFRPRDAITDETQCEKAFFFSPNACVPVECQSVRRNSVTQKERQKSSKKKKKKKKKKTVFFSLVGLNVLRGAHCDRQNNNNQQQQQRRNQSAAHLDLHSLRDDGW